MSGVRLHSLKWLHGLIKVVAAAAVLTLASCVHEFPDEIEEPRRPVTLHLNFDYELPPYVELLYENGSLTSRLESKEDKDVRYIVGFYRSTAARAEQSRVPDDLMVLTKDDITDLAHDIELDLPAGVHTIMVWADYVQQDSKEDLYYDASDFSSITLKTPHTGNEDYRDAFRGTVQHQVSKLGGDDITVEMRRPMAKYKFLAADFEEFYSRAQEAARAEASRNGATTEGWEGDPPVNLEDYKVVFRYSGFMPHVYNMFTDKPSDATTGISYTGYIKDLGDGRAELGFDYVLVNGKESLVTVTVEIYDKSDKMISASAPINVPLKRSMLTVISGEFLTSQAQGGVGIVPDFEGEYNIVIQ